MSGTQRRARRWYTPREVAKACHVSPQAVRAWLASGRLVGFKRSRYWQVTAEELSRAALASRRPLDLMAGAIVDRALAWGERFEALGEDSPESRETSRKTN